ncbi:ABC transporter permease [Nocardioides sp.]|uniref:ABC transporter permease n=1 Tax=Nocardioides sp. TaxID=35761 RepID=UPI002726D38A|nr:FtsX-like permease family protein [Nocardioides sp.]MDO9455546.1 FtsX-like permease family protein [Nocardioides sp.]
MTTVLLASLRTYTRRYVSAALAVVIGVAFVIVTAGLTSAARDGLTAGVGAPYDGSDVVLTLVDGTQVDRLVTGAADRGAEASVLGWTQEPVTHDGTLVDRDTEVGEITTSPTLRWQELSDGAFPTGPGEAAVDRGLAREHDLAVGDVLEVGSGPDAATVTVTGLVESPSALVAGQVYLTWPDLRPLADRMYVDSVAWAGPADAARDLAPTAEVADTATHVADLQREVSNGVDVLTILLLVFATIALVVAVIVIANTFSILFAQRRHDLALLRCVGATRRQLLRSIRAEALALGLVATAVGLVVGAVGGRALVAVVSSRWPESRLGEASVSPAWYAGGLVVGLLVTLVASWLPTRSATRADPLSALRPDGDLDVRSGAGRLRLALGSLLVLGGAALLAAAVVTTTVPTMLAGGVATFVGVLVLGPWLVPGLLGVVGGVASRLGGTPARLAAGNARRHPKRTATTAASLLVGVTLTTAVLTGMASSRGALLDEMDVQHPVDAVVTTERVLPADAVDEARASDQVAGAVALDGVTATLPRGGGELLVLAVDDTSTARDASGVTPHDGQVLLPFDLAATLRTTLTVGDRSARLEVVGGEGFGDVALVTPATLARLTDAPEPRALWVAANDDADPDLLEADLQALTQPYGGTVENGLADRAWVEQQLDVLTAAVVGLLGIAVVIALIGIANTLGLSVLERGREHALLRAIGLTRRQLRATLALESVLLSVVATVLGTALGVTFAWVGIQTMVRSVVEDAPVVLPVGQLTVVVAVSAVAGLLACVLPARRAARVSPAAGLALD